MKKYLPLISLVLVFLLLPLVAFADSYTYYVLVGVYNNSSTTYTNLPLLVNINNTQLFNLGYITSSGLDTNLLEGATGRTYSTTNPKLGIFVPTVGSYQKRIYDYRLGYSPPQTTFPLIVGVGGNITILDDPDLELGGNFTVEQRGYIDTSSGSNKNLIYKVGAFRVYVSAAGNITVTMNPGGSEVTVTASNVYTGIHTINATTMDETNLKIFVDEVERGSTALGGVAVTDNGNIWVLIENEVMPYMEYIKIWIR